MKKYKIQSASDFFRGSTRSWAALETEAETPNLFTHAGVIFLFIFVLVAAIYAVVTKVPVVVQAPGKIESVQPAVPIRANATFTIEQILVKENQLVNEGDVLIRTQEYLKPDEVVKLNEYIKDIDQINNRPEADNCLDCLPILETISQKYLNIHTHETLTNILSPLNDMLRSLKSQVTQFKQVEISLGPYRRQVQTAKRKLKEIRSRGVEDELAKDVEDLESTIVQAQAHIDEKYKASRTQILELRGTIQARTKELSQKLEQYGKAFQILAPIAGKVVNLKMKGTGELVSNGQVMMELLPAQSKLKATVDVSSKDIANVEVGHNVILSIDSLPEVDYGFIEGRILEVSQADHEQEARQPGNKVFKVNVQLPVEQLQRGDEVKPLMVGMTLQAKIIVKEESLAKSAYRVLFKVKEGLQVKK